MNMKTWMLALVAVLGLGLWSPPSGAAEPSAMQVAQQVQRFYDGARTYTANFRQVYRVKAQNVTKVSTGKVAFAKPGKISFRYDKPSGNRVVSDGSSIKVYEREAKQMYKTKVDKSQYPAALAFLMGEGKLVRDFDLRLLDASAMKVENGYVLLATPKTPTPSYKKLLLYVDAPTSQVRRVLILDAQGNRNRFDFTEPVVNRPIPDAEFRFTPPQGTSIVTP